VSAVTLFQLDPLRILQWLADACSCSRILPQWQTSQAVDITARIERRSALGGLISEYRRVA
jgi:hypothetical protein